VADLKGFWSYVHADDDADGGRVSRLAQDVVEQFEMLTGETISPGVRIGTTRLMKA
jgi:hypothetical protein